MAQDLTRQTEIKNCLEFFFPSVSLRILKQEGYPDVKRYFFAWLIFLHHFSSQGVVKVR